MILAEKFDQESISRVLEQGHPDDTLIRCQDVVAPHQQSIVTRRTLQCLRRNAWITDEVLDLTLSLLQEEHKGTFFASTHLFPKLRDLWQADNFAKEWKACEMQKLFYVSRGSELSPLAHETVVVPMYVRERQHWALCSIRPSERVVTFWDSLPSAKVRSSSFAEVLMRWLVYERCKQGDPPEGWSEWKGSWHFQNKKSCPQQSNISDCGVFVCFFAEMVAANGDIPEDVIQTEGRRRMTAALLSLNRFCGEVEEEETVRVAPVAESSDDDMLILDNEGQVIEVVQATSTSSTYKGVASSEVSVHNIITEARGRSKIVVAPPPEVTAPRRRSRVVMTGTSAKRAAPPATRKAAAKRTTRAKPKPKGARARRPALDQSPCPPPCQQEDILIQTENSPLAAECAPTPEAAPAPIRNLSTWSVVAEGYESDRSLPDEDQLDEDCFPQTSRNFPSESVCAQCDSDEDVPIVADLSDCESEHSSGGAPSWHSTPRRSAAKRPTDSHLDEDLDTVPITLLLKRRRLQRRPLLTTAKIT
eukprot:Filipodium_phascolosomae@DN1724_c0_g1_i1.p1